MRSLVYLCRNGKNQELIYSIRSACENLDFDKLIIVGGKPSEIVPDLYIHVPQNGRKFVNAYNNLKQVCLSKGVGEDLILMNDDFFILKKPSSLNLDRGDYEEYRQHYVIPFTGKNEIHYQIDNTIEYLSKSFNDIKSYELHAPMQFNKKIMAALFEEFGEKIYEYQIRSLYKNLENLKSSTIKDIKYHSVNDNVDFNQTFISTNDQSFNYGKPGLLIRERFSRKSIYEK